jgi:uncharacterized membrane protein
MTPCYTDRDMKDLSSVEKRARNITKWVGSPSSIILHTLLFAVAFILAFLGVVSFDRMLLVLTTIVSLEAIYLAIFIQMTINQQSEAIAEVEQDLDEIQEDIEDIQEDVEEIGEDMEELQEDVEEIGEDLGELEEEEGEEEKEERRKREQKETLENIYDTMQKLAADIEMLKK